MKLYEIRIGDKRFDAFLETETNRTLGNWAAFRATITVHNLPADVETEALRVALVGVLVHKEPEP